MKLRDMVDVLVQLLDLVLDRLDLSARTNKSVPVYVVLSQSPLARAWADIAEAERVVLNERTSAKKGPRSLPIRLCVPLPLPLTVCMAYESLAALP